MIFKIKYILGKTKILTFQRKCSDESKIILIIGNVSFTIVQVIVFLLNVLDRSIRHKYIKRMFNTFRLEHGTVIRDRENVYNPSGLTVQKLRGF
jgi:hypothetical protein